MCAQGVDVSTVKKRNKELILQILFEKGVISRVTLAKELGMSKPAINEHIDALMGIGIIRAIGTGESSKSGGRRPVLIEPNPKYKTNIAIDLNFTKPLIAIGTVTGMIIDSTTLNTSETFDEDSAFVVENFELMIKKTIDGLLSKNNIMTEDIGVIVISTPGIINEESGEIYVNPQHKPRHTFSARKYLQESYGVKVLMKNDVNMAALGEAAVLRKRGINDILFVSCGLGVGSALILNGRLIEGHNHSAGEIGYFMESENYRTLDERTRISTLLKRLRELPEIGRLSFDETIEAYRNKNDLVLREIRNIGKLIGVSINNAVSLYDVDTVVVGGEYCVFQDTILREIDAVMQHSKLPNKPNILPPALQYMGGITGCLTVATNYTIKSV